MRSKYILLVPLVVILVLTAIPESLAEAGIRWRGTEELPGYPYLNQDPWAWKSMASQIGTVAIMDFGEHRRGMRPLVNFYMVGDKCKDPVALKVYRTYIEDAIAYLAAYRDWFVQNYPQFSYLKKLRFQISNGTVKKALNIPVEIVEGCYDQRRASAAILLERVWLSYPGATLHELTHAIGSHEICVISWEGGLPKKCESPYYQFYTLWGWIGDIGTNTLTWYALALSWSWLYFYDEHPGTASDDYASKLPSKPKYSHLYTRKFYTEIFGTEVELYRYVVTLKDMLESGIIPRMAVNVAELRLGGGAVIPTLSLWPEEWMVGHPIFDYVDDSFIIFGGRVAWNWTYQGQVGLALPRGFAVGYRSFSSSNPLFATYVPHAGLVDVKSDWLDLLETIYILFITEQPWTDVNNLQYLLFPDMRPDLHFCGYVYRWRGQQDEKVVFTALVGNESFRPSLRPGERMTYRINCYYQWGPYAYRAPHFYFQEELIPTVSDTSGREYYRGIFVIVGVPASEKIIQESLGTRRVFSGIWLVNGTEWPGPYLDLDILGWKVEGKPPERRPLVTGRVPGAFQPGWGPSVRLYDPNGPIRLDNFTQRYRSFERVPWMVGVTFLKLRHNTTAEPLYYREHFVNITIPEGFKILDGNLTGWYREGTRIRLPRLSELQISKGTKLVLEGWKGNSGRIYRPGEELVVDGPKSFEPVLAKYHLVSVKGPKELKQEGSGWYREGSMARLNVVENVTYVSDVTRYVFLGFRRGNETVNEIEVRVDGPVEVEAVWRREHLLTARSRFLDWTFTNPWFKEYATYAIIIPGGLQNLGNGTLIEVKGVEVLTGSKRFVAERADIQSINITIGGARVITLWNATFTVHGPIEMHVLWTVKYALDVRAPAGVVSIIAVYRDQILVWPRLRGQDESITDPDLVVLRSDLGEVVSEGGKAVWLDRYLTLGLRSIEWRVVKAVYKDVDVTVNATVRAGEPGTIALPAGISGLIVRVTDVLGMPVPFASVAYSGPGGEVKASTDYSGVARLGLVPNGQGRLSAGLIGASEGEVLIPPGEHIVVLPVSPYTITLITLLITPTYMVVRRRKNE